MDMAPNQDTYLGTTTWYARTGPPFNGQAIPCGSTVSFLPTKPRSITGKAAPRTWIGMFLGYSLQLGATWCGANVVLELDFFVGKNLGIDAHYSWGNINQYVAKHELSHASHMCSIQTTLLVL